MKRFRRFGKFYVYMVQCQDGSYYTGYTNDLDKRIREHNNTKRRAKYLRGKVPVRLVYAKEYRYYKNALDAERNLKKLTGKQKEGLIRVYERTE